VTRLPIPSPYSGGLLLSYRCAGACKHCVYACSPRWPADWIAETDAERVLAQLAERMRPRYPDPNLFGLNDGLHFSGGEPFLNFDLLLRLTEIAARLGVPSLFVETNGFWCREDEETRSRLLQLREAGLRGMLVSANPFVLEHVPFDCTRRAARISREVFGGNAVVYQGVFYDQFQSMGLHGTLPLDVYLEQGGYGLHHAELIANGRVPYQLGHLYHRYPASRFFGASCFLELIRDWHIHVDNYCNLLPGYCAGLSLGDARNLDGICRGIELDEMPVLRALLNDLEELYRLGRQLGYVEQEGYVSKCHLCLDVRRHLARSGDFVELEPKTFYERLED